MGKFNVEDYSTVEERLIKFHAKYPDGRVLTELLHIDGYESENNSRLVVIKATLYADGNPDSKPLAEGMAKEREGMTQVNRTSFVENCETSAIGRALANAGFQTSKNRPSREEMEAVERAALEHRVVLAAIKKIATDSDVETKNNIRRRWDEAKEDLLVAQKLLTELETIKQGD